MTTPDKRTRSLRFGWEFLMELHGSDNLTIDQRSTVETILCGYPSGDEIKQWANECAKGNASPGAKMAPEDPVDISNDKSTSPDSILRGRITPTERTRALLCAYEFFGFDFLISNNLMLEQRHQIQYVLRHFPKSHEIELLAEQDSWWASKNPAYRQWLALVPSQCSAGVCIP